jgi:uncharacterized repeat protein (TIGR03803 family)
MRLQNARGFSTLLILTLASSFAVGQQKTILYNFTGGNDGGIPFGGVTLYNGSLYGAASTGGDQGCDEAAYCGTVFQLTPPVQKGGTWTEATIYTFGQQANDGSIPMTGVVFDSLGNLYGTTSGYDLYELVPGLGGQWTSYWPVGAFLPPAVDKSNNLYQSEFDNDVIELTPTGTGTFTQTTIYTFAGGTDGQAPEGLTVDAAGRIWGITSEGGNMSCAPFGCGTVFVLLPPSQSGGAWTHHVLFSFPGGSQGYGGYYPPAIDARGNLYGINIGPSSSRCVSGVCGQVWELSPPGQKGAAWTYSVLHVLQAGNDGDWPQGGLVLDSAGHLYGTTVLGGGGPCVTNGKLSGCGTIFRLSPPKQKGGTWTEAVFRFHGGSDGQLPYGSVALDQKNNVAYGTTSFGGKYNSGTVFQILP